MSDAAIDRTVGFHLGGVEETAHAFAVPLGAELFSYARRENPTVVECERALAEVEGCEWCVLTPSGMAAINTALSIFNAEDDRRPWIFPADVYSGTAQYAVDVLKRQRGTNVCLVELGGADGTTSNLIRAIEQEPPALVFIEPISNPMVHVIDVPAVASAARQQGARVVVDNTIGTPFLYKPLDADADLVVHSATKYLAGHNDILAGVIGVNDADLRAQLLLQRSLIGSVLSPDDAGRLKSQLATFALRLARQNATAMQLAQYLESHPAVAQVRYSGLTTHADHAVAKRLFGGRGFGGLIAFDLARDAQGCSRFVDDLMPSIPHIASMGDVTTTFLHIQACFGEAYQPASIRLSVGVEPAEQIIAWLDKALGASRNTPAR